jgi:hypothetical protein
VYKKKKDVPLLNHNAHFQVFKGWELENINNHEYAFASKVTKWHVKLVINGKGNLPLVHES